MDIIKYLVYYLDGYLKVTTNRARRNGIPCAAPGDKFYIAAEYAPGFYLQRSKQLQEAGRCG